MSRTSLENLVRLEALGLAIGESLPNVVCPSCKAEHERSFSITRTENGLLYNCYRVSCKAHGFVPTGSLEYNGSREKQFVPKPYKFNTQALTKEQALWFEEKYGLQPPELASNGFKYNPDRDTYVFPIYDYRGYEAGVVDRSYTGRVPKAITYWHNDVVKLHFPQQELASEAVVIVEDTLSAIKCARHKSCVALLGSALTDDSVRLLSGMFKDIILALDPDAHKNALRLRNKYSLDFRNFSVLTLSKDPKDMNEKELQEVLNF